jgi:RNA polymerase sigma-70 factor (ECF subfamily)
MTLVDLPPAAGGLGTPQAPGPLDELALVERARTDGDAFAQLYRLYLPRIHAFAYRRSRSREVAEDVTAATFEQALRSLPCFEWKGGGFGPWLFRIAANELVDHYRTEQRTRGRRANRPLGRLEALPTAAGFDEVDEAAGAGRLLTCLSTLNPRYQKAISLRYLAGLSPAEAAEAMGITKPVLAVTLHRALAALRRALEKDDGVVRRRAMNEEER